MLRYVADLPEAEVAQTLGCSVGTVKTHASRGLAALRKSVGGRAVSGFDFDALRDPVAPDPGARQRAARRRARRSNFAAGHRRTRHRGECDVDRRRARGDRGRCGRGDVAIRDRRSRSKDRARRCPPRPRRTTAGPSIDGRFVPPTLVEERTRRVARDVPRRRDHDAALPAGDEDRATRLRWRQSA